MSYERSLSQVFTSVYVLPDETVKECVAKLLDYDAETTPNGSSFAVTSDAPQGFFRLWLSDASYAFLHRNQLTKVFGLWTERKAWDAQGKPQRLGDIDKRKSWE